MGIHYKRDYPQVPPNPRLFHKDCDIELTELQRFQVAFDEQDLDEEADLRFYISLTTEGTLRYEEFLAVRRPVEERED